RDFHVTGVQTCALPILPILVVTHPHDFRHWFLLALCAFSVERCLYFGLKNAIRRRRPPHILDNIRAVVQAADRFSLPSGHTSARSEERRVGKESSERWS